MSDAKFRELVGIAIGEASMCWSEMPSGVFDSTRAKEIVDRICAYKDRKAELESKIIALQESMRPLLEEWGKL